MPLRCHKTTMNLGWTPRKHGSFVASMPGCSLSRFVREEAVLCALVTNPVCCVLCVHACGGHGVWCRRISVRRTPWQACSLQPARFGWLCRPHAKHNALSRSDLCCLWWLQLRYHVGMKLREQGGSLVDLYTSLTGITLSPY